MISVMNGVKRSSETAWVAGSRPRGGMTLAELLIAMVILLVGIYAVAKGFPTLFQQVQADADRTAMARLTARTLNQIKANADRLPEAIFGYDIDNKTTPPTYNPIPPDQEPKDPDEVDMTVSGPNVRDDIIHIVGERIKVPAPHVAVGGTTRDLTVSVPLMMGLVGTDPSTDAANISVYQLVPLVRTDEQPTSLSAHTSPGTFYINPVDGIVSLPTQAQGVPTTPLTTPTAVIDYAWTDNTAATPTAFKPTYYAQGERVTHGVAVRGVTATTRVVLDECRAWLVVPLTFGDAGGANLGYAAGNPQPAAGSFYLEYNYGATLLFNPEDQGRELCVDYAVRTGWPGSTPIGGRRELMLHEDQQVPAANQGAPYTVQLSVGGINDEDPLIDDDLGGTGSINPVSLLVVDLTDGQAYADGSATVQNVDFTKGIVTFSDTAPCLGHVCRFYYRTLDQHSIQVLKAPATFLPKVIADTYADKFDVAYRTYDVVAPDASDSRTRLVFPESSAGQTVSVDYTYGLPPKTAGATPPLPAGQYFTPQRITGELHVINDGAFQVALNHSDVVSIVAVRGVSVNVRGWWRAQKGKLRHVDVDCCLMPGYMAGTLR